MPRWVFRGTIAVVVVAVAAAGGAGWWVQNQALTLSHAPDPYTVQVTGLDAGLVTLSRNTESRARGRYRLEWLGGSALLSDVVTDTAHGVTRRMSEQTGQPLRVGLHARFESVYRGDPQTALGLSFQDVAVPTPLGPMPAWIVPGTRTTWAVVVHGYGASRQEGLYFVPTLHALGIPSMVVTYRNDVGAPRGPRGLVHFGQSEWHDVDAAVSYARAHGAQDVILLGDSMGGAIVAELVRHSAQAAAVRALVLDGPALDFGSDMAFGARVHGLRGPLNWFVIGAGRWAMHFRAGINFHELNQVAHAREFHVPILLYQGDADTAVPVSGADTFARARPDLVTYVRVHSAGHVESWNVDQGRYEHELAGFVGRTAGAGQASDRSTVGPP